MKAGDNPDIDCRFSGVYNFYKLLASLGDDFSFEDKL